MKKPDDASALVVGGVGIISSLGQGKNAFLSGLLEGRQHFDYLRRPGRQRPGATGEDETPFLGAEISTLTLPTSINVSLLRSASFSAQAALIAVDEAWQEAGLDDVAPERVGLVIGGSNIQQRDWVQLHHNYRDRERYLRPAYGLSFMDSDLCGLCSQAFGIRGMAYTVGGASASGQLAIIEAAYAVLSGRVDVCIAAGALMDLSYWECQGLRSLGAMGSSQYARQPELACRPFDQSSDGFIFGEMCGAVVIESASSLRSRGRLPWARLSGWGMCMDANRNPNPSAEGEVTVMRAALRHAALSPADIDYVNPHGTGSALGDKTELESLRRAGLGHVWLNTTKSIIGHGLSAAGSAEVVALLLQMQAEQLHPSRNLENPIADDIHWVGKTRVSHKINNALSLSMGFGGINTALCWQRCA